MIEEDNAPEHNASGMGGVGQELVQNKRMNKALECFLHIVRGIEVLPEAY